MRTLKNILKPLASLWLTVPLLLLAMLLVYAGTTVQKQMGIQDVQKQFFHSWLARAPLDPMFRPFAAADSKLIPGGVWIPGGYSLIVLLLANLFAAHSVRFKLNWKRSGIILIHLGLIVLLFGEVFANLFSVESQMAIDQGQTVAYTQDIRHVELSVVDPTAADHNRVTVIDDAALRPGAVIQAPALPFTIRVDDYFANSRLLGPMQQADGAIARATAGNNQRLRVAPEEKTAGTEQAQDVASAFVTITAGNRTIGTYLLTQWANPRINQPMTSPYFGMVTSGPQTIDVDGKTYQLDLRFRRYYKPYQVTLLKFSHDLFPGTDTPRNFSSRIRLVDPSRHVDREVLIWMNHPLTYPSLRGETFYQQSFLPGDRTTILQVTHNPAWPLPYMGLAMGLLGMLVHFGMHLVAFLRRTRSPAFEQSIGWQPTAAARGGGRYTLKPHTNWASWIAAAGAAIVFLAVVISVVAAPAPEEKGLDLGTFGELPVFYGGRAMPLDSLARVGLKVVSQREWFTDDAGKRHPAILWLADTMAEAPGSFDYKVIRIDYPDIISQLGLNADSTYFSLNELLAHKDVVQRQFDLAIQVPEKQRDGYQKHIVELAQHIELYLELQNAGRLYLVPPARDGDMNGWRTLAADKSLTPGAEPVVSILRDYHDGAAHDFNVAVDNDHHELVQRLPATMAKVDFEAFFNRANPFAIGIWLYVVSFTIAACSWLGLRKILWGAAMGALGVIFAFHTFGLASRIYITGWGPVTNLYSAAIFIGWAVVLMSLGLELIYRNGIGAAVASIIGCASLIVAYFLGADGDTMREVQAVLATKFWLWTHVPCVTLGYAATYLAGTLGIAYIMLGVFTDVLQGPRRTMLARMTYGITCFAILFSFVGTILGGIWADYSWGRFWGWDPKENGAILIVLWNAIILHARWGGMVRERGFMVLAVLGNIVTSWSFFGTNLLGIGLHAYGFIEGAPFVLTSVMMGHLMLAAIGLVPQRLWRSFADAPASADA